MHRVPSDLLSQRQLTELVDRQTRIVPPRISPGRRQRVGLERPVWIRQDDPKAGRVLVARGHLAAPANDARGVDSLDRSEISAGI